MTGAGVLLPVGSIPGGFSGAYRFVDWLTKGKQKYWQVLPLNPRDSYLSPYNSPNSLAIDQKYGSKNDWFALKKYANNRGIKIIGDVPYFVAWKSREFEANKRLFLLGKGGRPRFFSGAPPDVYSRKGQFWGHPLFDWEVEFDRNLAFFLQRLTWACRLYDVVRLDHFRGYSGVWAIPVGRKSGKSGQWLPVPGEKILAVARAEFPRRVFIAEDLGVITAEVEGLRKKFKFLGSSVMLWNKVSEVKKDEVLYTSVHDSETVRGFSHDDRAAARFINRGMDSRATIFIIAMQDVLNLGSSARLNHPGKPAGNWGWQINETDLTAHLAERLAKLTVATHRGQV